MRSISIIIVLSLLLVGCDWSTFADDIDNTVDNFRDDNTETNQTNKTRNIEIREVRIASWNIDAFGESLMRENLLINVIEETIIDFEIFGVQGIADDNSFKSLMSDIDTRDYVISQVQGHDENKEQYAFIFNDEYIELLDDTSYPDDSEVFLYDPYIAYFNVSDEDFIIIQFHANPTDATYEIRRLEDVYDYAVERYDDSDVIIMGNLYADCAYFNTDELDDFYWLIDDRTDTTTIESNCAYDRIIVSREIEDDIKFSDVYMIEDELGVDNEMLRAISDHYPVYSVLSIDTLRIER